MVDHHVHTLEQRCLFLKERTDFVLTSVIIPRVTVEWARIGREWTEIAS